MLCFALRAVNTAAAGHKAWAFGLGLERLAMVLFDIPDIRWGSTAAGERQIRHCRACPVALPQALALALCLRQDHTLPFCPWPHRPHDPILTSSLLFVIILSVHLARLFWSDDERFLKQFKAGDLKAKFKSYSKFPPCYKDMAFWVSPEFTENNLCELVRGAFGKLMCCCCLCRAFPVFPSLLGGRPDLTVCAVACCAVRCCVPCVPVLLLQASAATWLRRCS